MRLPRGGSRASKSLTATLVQMAQEMESMPGPACDPIPLDNRPIAGKVSSIGDPEWGMYVTPDDPLRDTPEKARAYYESLFRTFGVYNVQPEQVKNATEADVEAAKALLGASAPMPDDPRLDPAKVQSYLLMAGLKDLLVGDAPSAVLASGSAIHRLIERYEASYRA